MVFKIRRQGRTDGVSIAGCSYMARPEFDASFGTSTGVSAIFGVVSPRVGAQSALGTGLQSMAHHPQIAQSE
jgi:hypothetical protein